MARKPSLAVLLALLFFLCSPAHCRLIGGGSDLVSDGVDGGLRGPRLIRLGGYLASDSCDQTYGFMPCTGTALGNLFLLLVYGYLMFVAATYLSKGSELLLEILGPGIIGGLTETAQSQVSVGMGLLAGSTVMLLTVIWGTCVIVGKCDFQDSVAVDGKDTKIAVDGKDTKGFSLTGSGVSTDIWTSYGARIMAISVIPFIVVQLLQVLNSTSGRHLAILIALILSLLLLISYCLYQKAHSIDELYTPSSSSAFLQYNTWCPGRTFGIGLSDRRSFLPSLAYAYQIFQPKIQQRRLAYAKHKHVKSGILNYLKKHSLGRLSTDQGTPNKEVIERLFHALDLDKDGHLSRSEIKALILGIQLKEIDFDVDKAATKVIEDLDTN
ncbi:hypothetical protein RJ640_004391, partial [Escallonia rubra]